MDLPILDISYKWNHITHDLWGGVSGFFSLMFLRFIHVAECMNTFFLLTNNILLHGYTTFSLTISQLIDIWVVSTFRLLWIKLLWTFVYKFLWRHVFISLEHISKSGITQSYSIPMFKILRNCQIIFPSDYTTSAQSAMNKFQFLHILTCSVFIIAILVGVKWFSLWFWLHFPAG